MKLTIQQAADKLRVCRNTVYALCRAGKVRARRGKRGAWIVYLSDDGLLWSVHTMADGMDRTPRRIQQLIKGKRLEAFWVGGQLRIPAIHGIKLVQLRGGR